jgi:hypothetical protein
MKRAEIYEKVDFKFDSPYDRSQQVKIFKNPSHLEMLAVKNQTEYKELRGLLVNNIVVYIWDANLATHGDVQALLPNDYTYTAFIIGDDDSLISADPKTNLETLQKNLMIRRMMNYKSSV